MKPEKIVLVLVVVIMLASVVGSYFLFMQQDQLSGKRFETLKADIEKLNTALANTDGTFKDFQVQAKGYADSIKALEDKMSVADAERKDITGKVDELMKAVEGFKVSAKAALAESVAPAAVAETPAPGPEPEATVEPAPTAQDASVDLGSIPVEKQP